MKPLQHKVSDAFSPSKNVSYSPGCVRLFWLCNRCFVSTGRCWIPGKKQNSNKKKRKTCTYGRANLRAVVACGLFQCFHVCEMKCRYHSLLFPIRYILLSLYPCPPSAVAHWLLSMVIKCKHVLSVVPQLHFAIRAGQWFSRHKSSVIHWRTTSNIYMCILINHYISGFALLLFFPTLCLLYIEILQLNSFPPYTRFYGQANW